jgi:predicted nucleotidyltransferase
MITDKDKRIILEIARRYRATRVVLFGSALSGTAESRDIDLAVDGVADKDFYAFYGELMCELSKPVDIIDLSRKSKFTDMVLQEGVPLHA